MLLKTITSQELNSWWNKNKSLFIYRKASPVRGGFSALIRYSFKFYIFDFLFGENYMVVKKRYKMYIIAATNFRNLRICDLK